MFIAKKSPGLYAGGNLAILFAAYIFLCKSSIINFVLLIVGSSDECKPAML